MKSNIREYDRIRFFRGSKKNDAELERLAKEHLDFEYRRLLIQEKELDLHVAFSRMIVWNRISWIFLVLSIFFIQNPIIFYRLMVASLMSQYFSYKNKKRFGIIFRGYSLGLRFVDAVIKKEYGITMPEI
jgi:hypothetical protein